MVTPIYIPIAFDERVTFGFNMPGHYLVLAHLLHCIPVCLCDGYMLAYVQIIQHTHRHKAMTGHNEAKKFLSSKAIKL